jgi:hypothetical protein
MICPSNKLAKGYRISTISYFDIKKCGYETSGGRTDQTRTATRIPRETAASVSMARQKGQAPQAWTGRPSTVTAQLPHLPMRQECRKRSVGSADKGIRPERSGSRGFRRSGSRGPGTASPRVKSRVPGSPPVGAASCRDSIAAESLSCRNRTLRAGRVAFCALTRVRQCLSIPSPRRKPGSRGLAKTPELDAGYCRHDQQGMVEPATPR